MTGQIKVVGMVLSAMPIGEYDKRITILTRERGKISAFARGARKPTSTFLACSQPFSFGEFTLYEGRSSYNVSQAEITAYFSELREDLNAVYYGMYLCEFTDYMTRENLEAGEELKLLYLSLKALTCESIGAPLVRNIFELRYMGLNGEMPKLHECAVCGEKEELLFFDAEQNGMICANCKSRQNKKMLPVSPSTLYTMQYVAFSPLEKLYTFCVTESVAKEFADIMRTYLNIHVGHEMNAEEMIRIIERFGE